MSISMLYDDVEPSPSTSRTSSAPMPATPLTVVVICDHAFVSGGLAQVAITSARELARRGHKVIYFSAVGPVATDLDAQNILGFCLDQPDMLNDPSRLHAAARAMWNGRAARTLSAVLSGLNVSKTIVHVHGWSKALSPSIIKAARSSGLAVVQTLHDYVLLCPNGALYDYVKKQNCTLTPMSHACISHNCDARHYAHKLWRVARHALMGQLSGALKGTDLIVISNRQKVIAEQHLLGRARVHQVTNPVDVDDLGAAPVGSNDGFVFIGRLSTEKGPQLLLEAAGRVGARTVFVGDGPLRDSISGKPNVTMTGWQNKAGVLQHLRQARALVFPSVWYETFGLTVYEALANGVPVIVSDNTTAADAVEDGRTGLLFKSGDASDLARCLERLKDPDEASRMGRAAYQRYWSAPPTVERHAECLENVYREVISGTANTAPDEPLQMPVFAPRLKLKPQSVPAHEASTSGLRSGAR